VRPAFVSFTAKISAGRREVQTGRGSTHAARHTATALPALSRGLALRPPATRTGHHDTTTPKRRCQLISSLRRFISRRLGQRSPIQSARGAGETLVPRRLCTRFDVGGDHRGDAVSRRRNHGRRSSVFAGSAMGTCVCSCTASLRHSLRSSSRSRICARSAAISSCITPS